MPTIGGGDDFVWIGGPGEGLWLLVVVGDEAIDGGLEIDDVPLKTPRLRRRLVRMAKKPSPGGSPRVTGAPWVLNRSRPPKYQSARAAPAGTRSSARSSGVHMLVVTLPGRAGKKRKNDMDSAKRCRDESAECLRLMKLAQSETEARVLRDLAHSWVRLANQIDRYIALVKSNGPPRADVMPPQETGVAPRSGI